MLRGKSCWRTSHRSWINGHELPPCSSSALGLCCVFPGILPPEFQPQPQKPKILVAVRIGPAQTSHEEIQPGCCGHFAIEAPNLKQSYRDSWSRQPIRLPQIWTCARSSSSRHIAAERRIVTSNFAAEGLWGERDSPDALLLHRILEMYSNYFLSTFDVKNPSKTFLAHRFTMCDLQWRRSLSPCARSFPIIFCR
jgi:hypothetical protein